MRNGQSITAYIGLGSNLGDRAANIFNALAQLSSVEGITLVRLSRLIETTPIGTPPGAPPFLNAAAAVTTTLGSHALLKTLVEIEKDLGRTRRDKWESRPIDLDLLLFGDQVISSDSLVVPHPLMHERSFVLAPLAEIAPDAVHPMLQMSIKGLLESLSPTIK